MDDFTSLSNRLLSRCPAAGILLSQQLINDAWHELQSRREWSWRRRSGVFAPPNLYQTGTASSNVAAGTPTLITGSGTTWTIDMVGRQIRVGGLLNPYYTIVGWISATSLLIDSPWAGPDVTAQVYQIMQIYYSVPADFNYFYTVISPKDGYRLWTNVTENDLALLDPQRTNTGQTYAVVYKSPATNYSGIIGPAVAVLGSGAAPISTTTVGYTYVANATYIVQIVGGGASGTATFQWKRLGQTAFTGPVVTSEDPLDLMDGVQVYFPVGTYVANDLFMVAAQAQAVTGGILYELWPGPTNNLYLYPYTYICQESDLTAQAPQLPPTIAARGEIILDMALAACARYPGPDVNHPNVYYSLKLAEMHDARAMRMMWDLERNDEEIGVSNITYQQYPYYPAPWLDASWQQSHAPFLSV